MSAGIGWLLTFYAFGLGDSPEPHLWREPAAYVYSSATNVEFIGGQTALYRNAEWRLTWVLRAGAGEMMAGLRGTYYLGFGWHVSADLGTDLFRGPILSGRLELFPIEGIRFATEWNQPRVQVAFWLGDDWDW